MALRFLLVGLVASMGFELPSGEDVAAWAPVGPGLGRAPDGRPARAWPRSRPSRVGEGRRPRPRPRPPAEVVDRADLAFEVVVEGMASDVRRRPGRDAADRARLARRGRRGRPGRGRRPSERPRARARAAVARSRPPRWPRRPPRPVERLVVGGPADPPGGRRLGLADRRVRSEAAADGPLSPTVAERIEGRPGRPGSRLAPFRKSSDRIGQVRPAGRAATSRGRARSSVELLVVDPVALAVAEAGGDPEDVAVRGERLAGPGLELLHGVHELDLVVGVLLLEGGRVDPPPPLLLGPSLAGGGATAATGSRGSGRGGRSRRSRPVRRS